MSERPRLRRADPARTEPIRNWAGVYRSAEGDGSRLHATDKTSTTSQSPAWNETVSRGVKLGYEVIEEHLRQGQSVAQKLSGQDASRPANGGELRDMAERIFRHSADLGSLWMDFLDRLMGSPEAVRNLADLMSTNGASETGPAASSTNEQRQPVSVEVTSVRPARITLRLQSDCGLTRLVVHDLRAAEKALPPLTEIRFRPAEKEAPAYFQVSVPNEQPAGLYHGVIMDSNSGQVCGTLTIHIREDSAQ